MSSIDDLINHPNSSTKRWLALLMLSLAVLITCTHILPGLSQLDSVKSRIEFNESRKIDGGATFYTDQPFLESLLADRES